MKPEELTKIIQAATSGQWTVFFGAFAGGVLSVLLASLVAYMRVKGKYWATREHFDETLQQQVDIKVAEHAALLQSAAERIEERISVLRAEVTASKEAEIKVIGDRLGEIIRETAAREDAKETGKLDAMERNLKRVLKQIKAVTTATEEIKQEIADEVWMRQTVRNEKRSIYATLCKNIGGQIHNHEQMLGAADKIRGNASDVEVMLQELLQKIDGKSIEAPIQFKPFVEEHNRLTKDFHESRTLLRIYCRPAALRAFDDFVTEGPGTIVGFRIGDALKKLKVLESRIASVASYDLELPVQAAIPEDGNKAIVDITCPECFKVNKVNRPDDPMKRGVPRIGCGGCSLKFIVQF